MYKIAIYTICKDELVNVDKWMKSMWEADYICVLDTGSTDGTYELLLQWQQKDPSKVILAQKEIKPWRFDVARNESMKLIPKDADICLSTDLDEWLAPTWAEKFREAWYDGCQRGSYLYAWSHKDNGEPGMTFWYDKAHDNSGSWSWKYPVHEYLVSPIPASNWCKLPDNFIALHHYPLTKTSRLNYLPLLELRAKEDPDDYYGLVYLAHEYFYDEQYEKCINFINTKVLPKLTAPGVEDEMECVPDLYLFMGNAARKLGRDNEAEQYFLNGIARKKNFRDNYIRLGQLYYDWGRYEDCIKIINDGLLYSRREYTWLETDEAWSWLPWDILCLAYWAIGARHMSLVCAETAYRFNPTDERLKSNVEILKKDLIL